MWFFQVVFVRDFFENFSAVFFVKVSLDMVLVKIVLLFFFVDFS